MNQLIRALRRNFKAKRERRERWGRIGFVPEDLVQVYYNGKILRLMFPGWEHSTTMKELNKSEIEALIKFAGVNGDKIWVNIM